MLPRECKKCAKSIGDREDCNRAISSVTEITQHFQLIGRKLLMLSGNYLLSSPAFVLWKKVFENR